MVKEMLHKPTNQVVKVKETHEYDRRDIPHAGRPWVEITFSDGGIYWELSERLEEIK